MDVRSRSEKSGLPPQTNCGVEEGDFVVDNSKTFCCSNYNCTSVLVKNPNSGEVYCSVDCHQDFKDIELGNQPINLGERNLRNLCRGGTGVLAERDKIIVTLNLTTGIRHSQWYAEPGRAEKPGTQKKLEVMGKKIEKVAPKTKQERKGIAGNSVSDMNKGISKINYWPQIDFAQELPLYKKHLVLVVFAVSPWEIYVQTKESSNRAREIQKICKEGLPDAWKTLNWYPTVGNYCVAQYHGECYRAKVLQVSDEFVEVQYVDYGNVSMVPMNQVSEMGLKLLLIAPQCYQCKIANIKPIDDRNYWNAESIECVKNIENCLMWVEPLVKDLANSGVVLARFYKSTPDHLVQGDFGDTLIEGRLAVASFTVKECSEKTVLFEPKDAPLIRKRRLLPEIESKVKISCVEDLSRFYVIIDEDQYSKMKTRMLKHTMLKKVFYKPEINDFCGAKVNNQWKRAKKLEDADDDIKVLCIDDGETAVVPRLDIIKLKKDMYDTPPLAVLCSLSEKETFDENLKVKAITHLKELSENGVTCYVEPKDLDGEKSYVRLLVGAEKIDFWTQIGKSEISEKVLVEESIQKVLVEELIQNVLVEEPIQTTTISTNSVHIDICSSLTLSFENVDIKNNDMDTSEYKIDIPIVKLKDHDFVFVSNFLCLNRCYVQTFEGADNLLDLHEKINENIGIAKSCIKIPSIGEIVLATYPGGVQYMRGVVHKIVTDVIVRIKFIDVGSEDELHFSDLRHPAPDILEFPITGAHVLLSGVPEESKKILDSDFELYCSKLSKNLRIEFVNGESDECKLYHLKQDRCVNEEILLLEKWQWQIARDIGKGTDEDIFEYEGKWPKYYPDLNAVQLPIGESVEMQLGFYADPKTLMCIPKVKSLERDLEVMETQMDLYLNAVKRTEFFPKANELHFSKKSNGKWMRCARISEFQSLAVDYGTIFDTQGNEIRRMPKDFLRIPKYAVSCILDGVPDMLPSDVKKAIKSIMSPRSVLKGEITGFCNTSDTYSVKFRKVEEILIENCAKDNLF